MPFKGGSAGVGMRTFCSGISHWSGRALRLQQMSAHCTGRPWSARCIMHQHQCLCVREGDLYILALCGGIWLAASEIANIIAISAIWSTERAKLTTASCITCHGSINYRLLTQCHPYVLQSCHLDRENAQLSQIGSNFNSKTSLNENLII